MPIPLDRWLGLFALFLGMAMFWIPKSPIYLIGSLILMFATLAHPIWNFWWIEKTTFRRSTAIIIFLLCLLGFGYKVWPISDSIKQAIPVAQDAIIKQYVPGNTKSGSDVDEKGTAATVQNTYENGPMKKERTLTTNSQKTQNSSGPSHEAVPLHSEADRSQIQEKKLNIKQEITGDVKNSIISGRDTNITLEKEGKR
jgi:hypothetical protein